MINKKLLIFGIIIVALLVVFFLTSISQNSEEQQKTVVKIGQFSSSFNAFPLFVAKEKGFFEEYGLEVELKEIEAKIAIPALLAKEIDYSFYIREGVLASLEGAPIKTIVTFTEDSSFFLVARPGLEMSDLKTIGIGSWSTTPHYLALKVIEENNLSAEIVTAGTVPTATAMLVKGQIDAVVQTALSAHQLQAKDYKILKAFDEGMTQGLFTSDDKIKNNPEEVQKVIMALQSAVRFIKNNPEETQELLFSLLKLEKNEVNQKIVEEIYSISQRNFSEEGVPASQEGINLLIKLAKVGEYKTISDIEKQTVTDEDISAAFDFSLVKQQ